MYTLGHLIVSADDDMRTMHGTSESEMYHILGLEATTADSDEKLSA
ncbi:hypothetical protein [Nostoc sp.]